jgi:hypothetical protein
MKGFLSIPKCGTNVEEKNLFLKLESEATLQRERFIVSRIRNCILNTYAENAYAVDFTNRATMRTKHICRSCFYTQTILQGNGHVLDEEYEETSLWERLS